MKFLDFFLAAVWDFGFFGKNFEIFLVGDIFFKKILVKRKGIRRGY